jgi:hypothetical protein
LTAATCTGGCQWSGTCAQQNPCPGGTGVTQAQCTTLAGGGDPQCNWTGSCGQTNPCPTGTTVTTAQCTTLAGGGDPQCSFTGSCVALCPTELTAATCTTPGCTWSGGCATQCTGSDQANCAAISSSCTWTAPPDGGAGVQSDAGGFVPYGWVPYFNVAYWTPDPLYVAPTQGYPDNTFSRGATFQQWLVGTGVTPPWTVTAPQYDVYETLPGVAGITGNVSRFAYSSSTGNFDASVPASAGGPNSVIDFTFDIDAGASQGAAGVAGRVMYTDMHLSEQTQLLYVDGGGLTISSGSYTVPVFNPTYTLYGGAHECLLPEAGLNAQERVAEYLFFDLGACTGSGLGVAQPKGSVPYFTTETYTLDLCMAPSGTPTGSGCPNTCAAANSSVTWRDFDWTAIIPSEADGGAWTPDSGLGPSIQFAFQSAGYESDLGTGDAGATATPIYTLPQDTTSGSYFKDVSTLFGPHGSQTWIRIYMTLSPDTSHSIAPTLTNYRQQFDCISSQ